MGPDLLGIIGATSFMVALLAAFALADRLLCGAWGVLRGSPGPGLVAGMTGWGQEGETRRVAGSPGSPDGAPPEPPVAVAPERVRGLRIQLGGTRVARFATA